MQDSYRDSASPRCAKCGWLVLSDEGVKVMKRRARAHLDNVMRCGLVWECPTCSAHIKAERAQEAEAVKAWHIADRMKATISTGWNELRRAQYAERTAIMATFTVRHGIGHDLGVVRAGVADAWKRFQQQREWRQLKARLGLVGTIRALETTWGDDHGWHPHLHVAMFFERPPAAELQHELFELWRRAVVHVLGREHEPIEYVYPTGDLTEPKAVGVVVTQCSQANYLAKLGLEITAPNTKAARDGHVTPLDMLAWFAQHQQIGRRLAREFETLGDDLDDVFEVGPRSGDLGVREQADAHFDAARAWLKLYRNYVEAMRGARQLTWSRGLKAAAGVGEKTDEEIIAGTDEADELITTVPTVRYNMLRRMPGAVATLLELAELHGRAACDRFVGIMCDEYTAAAREQLSKRGLVHSHRNRESVVEFLDRHGLVA